MSDQATPDELKLLREARREHALAVIAADQAALRLRRIAIEVAAAHDCEPEQIAGDGRIKRNER